MGNLKEVIRFKLDELSTFRVRFQMNNAIINILANDNLFEINQIFIIINIKDETKTFYANNEIKKYINFDKHLDEIYDRKFKFKILENILVNNKLDEFWNIAIDAIKNHAIREKPNIFIELQNKFNWNKNLGCFIYYKKRAPKGKKMTEKQVKHLINWFGFDEDMIYEIQKVGIIITTTWEKSKANKELYWKLKNKLFYVPK